MAESAANRLIGLTPRQRQVMDMVLAGQPSKNIAADLGISRRTVENHRAAIIKRTGSKCLPALARMAFAADRNGVPALPSLSDPFNTENPDRESSRKPPADRYSEAARPHRAVLASCKSGEVLRQRRHGCSELVNVKRQAKRINHKIVDTGAVPEQMSGIRPCYNCCLSSVLVLVVLSFVGGYGGYVPPHLRLRRRRHWPYRPDRSDRLAVAVNLVRLASRNGSAPRAWMSMPGRPVMRTK